MLFRGSLISIYLLRLFIHPSSLRAYQTLLETPHKTQVWPQKNHNRGFPALPGVNNTGVHPIRTGGFQTGSDEASNPSEAITKRDISGRCKRRHTELTPVFPVS